MGKGPKEAPHHRVQLPPGSRGPLCCLFHQRPWAGPQWLAPALRGRGREGGAQASVSITSAQRVCPRGLTATGPGAPAPLRGCSQGQPGAVLFLGSSDPPAPVLEGSRSRPSPASARPAHPDSSEGPSAGARASPCCLRSVGPERGLGVCASWGPSGVRGAPAGHGLRAEC
ncbi:collagen alpha-1(III) chain-like [Manis pentadactyla]|uniref:collagen alpha-1(III) chain-like n=1 Tax=Manis pentadactyla TaxID=143292 RepID=UPI00255CFE17|nr:collagen alpha-1(III) chain-like [Manis pentadactyla]